jgi:aspartokinase
MAHEFGIAGNCSRRLRKRRTHRARHTSETKISCCVKSDDVARALDVIAKQFEM